MKKFFFLCHVAITATICWGQDIDRRRFCDKYTYIQFRGESQHDYSILFDTIINNDTIEVDISDINLFIKSLFSQTYYIPISESAYQRGFDILFGTNKNNLDCGRYLINELGNQIEEVQRQGIIKLLNGDYVLYKYAEIRAGFVELDKNSEWKYVLSSIGIEDSSIIQRIAVPITIICTNKKNTELYIKNINVVQ